MRSRPMPILLRVLLCATPLLMIASVGSSSLFGQEPPNLLSIEPDLHVPDVTSESPGPGRRVSAVTTGWSETKVHHLLYLPTDWSMNAKERMPVLVEYAGNGGYRNRLGDQSDGTVEGTVMGYGLSGGKGYIWVSLPFVETVDGSTRNCALWWGDIEKTKKYCKDTVQEVCERFGGDPERVVLCGFSRGAIACNYIGLHDDGMAKLWKGFFCHSHYDGVRKWPYEGSDSESALIRLQRLRGRAQWISHEMSVQGAKEYLESSKVNGTFTFVPIPFPNHNAAWILRDIPERRQAREWLSKTLQNHELH